jgi:hypothetical protein
VLAAFNGTWDWTAVGTLTLAAVTLALAAATFWMVKLTRRALTQSRDEIALSRREVEEAHRPVVMPLADDRSMDLTGLRDHARARPWVEADTLYVPIENVGTGPALGIEATAELLNSAGGWSGAAGGEQPGAAAALGASSRIAVAITIPGLSAVTGFWLTITYSDVAGKGWLTKARYVLDLDRYADLVLNSQAEGAYGLRQDAELVKPVA